MISWKGYAGASVLLLLSGAFMAAMLAQSTISQDPAIGGYCPVAYVAAGKAIKGNPEHASVYDGRRYLFVNADAKKMFDENPAKFRIAYDSWCATAVAYGKKVASDPRLFVVHNGVTYLFSTADAKATFDRDKDGTIAKADQNWPKIR